MTAVQVNGHFRGVFIGVGVQDGCDTCGSGADGSLLGGRAIADVQTGGLCAFEQEDSALAGQLYTV